MTPFPWALICYYLIVFGLIVAWIGPPIAAFAWTSLFGRPRWAVAPAVVGAFAWGFLGLFVVQWLTDNIEIAWGLRCPPSVSPRPSR